MPESIPHAQNAFRQRYVPPGRFAVMYSGLHTPANPLTTLLEAAQRLQDDPRLLLMCIGGGNGKKEVDDKIAAGAKNIVSLPYQPLEEIKYSLSAADVHVVSMGDDMVGIVHPCKVYGAMTVARPVLLLGPAQCHISDLIDKYRFGWRIAHGDVAGAESVLREILATSPEELQAMGQRAAAAIEGTMSRKMLLAQFCDLLARGLPPSGGASKNALRATAPEL